MATFLELRERLYLSQSELAARCGVNKAAVWHWEHGLTTPSLAHQKLLVEILQCTREELLAALKASRAARERRGHEIEERPAA
jgi:transcriptional regulator with XRE-family HTH domain